jgi:hypothetical protein
MRVATLSLALALALAAPAAWAQEFHRPNDWMVRFDHAGQPDSAVYFVEMPPGWHITTGPAAILYDPARIAQGDYRVESQIFLFPVERREAFGVFIGGEDLEGPDQAYTYFLIRKDGSFLIKERSGNDTRVIHPWTEHPAILKHPGGEEPVKNLLAIEAAGETVRFLVNGQQVASVPRSEVLTEGVVGLRVNHNLNLHVTSLEVQPNGGR